MNPTPESDAALPSEACPVCGGAMRDIGLGLQCLGCLMDVAMDETAGLPSPGHRFGDYELHEELGRGGMGVVCRAWQPQLSRWVALKMLIGGVFAQPEFLERFRRESMAAARLKHPGIAVVHDVGEREGQAFYTMELLEGGSLADWIAQGNPDCREAAGMVEQTARAVAFAHQHAVLHRDLKPSNILLTSGGRTKVVDFGLALVIEETEESSPHPTLSQSALGTPAYMAPEVAEGGRAGVAADIYALGAVLYEMITGQPPHRGANPQAVLSRAREGAVTDPRRLNPRVPPDLATICLKCLDREPASRYSSADFLADDLQRYLEGKAVLARPIGPVGRAWRWARRNRTAAGLAAALALSVVGGGIAVVRQAGLNHRQAQALAGQERQVVLANAELSRQRYAADLRAAFQEWKAGNPEGTRTWLRGQELYPDKGVEWSWLWRQSAGQQTRDLFRGATPQAAVSFLPDGRQLVKITSDGALAIAATAAAVWRDSGLRVGWKPQFSATTQRLYFCQAGKVRSCQVHGDGSTGEVVEGPTALQITLAPGGRWAALGSVWSAFYQRGGGGVASVLDLQTGLIVWRAPEPNVCRMAVSADGRWLATAAQAGGVKLWDVAGRQERRHWDLPPVSMMHFSPDGGRLAVAGTDAAWLLDPAGPSIVNLPHARGHGVTEVAFSPDGQRLATSCTDRAVRVWTLAKPGEPGIFRGHEGEVRSVSWHPDGQSLVSCGRDGLVLSWSADQVNPPAPPGIPARFQKPWFGPDSASVISCGGFYPQLTSGRWSNDGGLLQPFPPNSQTLGFSQEGDAVLRLYESNSIGWWPPGAGSPRRTIPCPPGDTFFACQTLPSPDGRRLAFVDNTGTLTLHETSGSPPQEPRRLALFNPAKASPRLEIRAGSWSPEGNCMAFGGNEVPFSVILVDAVTLRITRLQGPGDYITGVAFSPDGRWLAASSVNGRLLIWDRLKPGTHPVELAGHDRSTADVVFSPDSRTLLSLGTLDGIKFWHTATWRELGKWPLADASSHLAISPDGGWLAVTCGEDGQPTRLRLVPLR